MQHLLAVLACATAAAASSHQIIAGGTAMTSISADTGKMSVEAIASSQAAVSAMLMSVVELDSDGQELSSGTSTQHKVAFSLTGSGAFSLGSITSDASFGVNAQASTSTSIGTLISGASGLSVSNQVLVYQAEGTVQPEGSGGLSVKVSNGTAEMRTTVSGWPWCLLSGGSILNDCILSAGRKAGAFLELEYQFETRKEAMVSADTDLMVAYDIGGGAELVMSKRAKVSGSFVAVADGYPKISASTATTLAVKVRIPKGTASGSVDIMYDPITRVSGGGASDARIIVGGDTSVEITSNGKAKMSSVSGARTAIAARIAGVSEVDASGQPLTDSDSNSHSMEISGSASGTFGLGVIRTDASLSVQSKAVLGSANFLGRASINQDVVVFTEAGTVKPEGEGGLSLSVRGGTLKTTARISNWPWCGSGLGAILTCVAPSRRSLVGSAGRSLAGTAGAYLDLRYQFDTRAMATMASSDATSVTFNLGDKANAVFSKRVKIGSSWTALADGYPRLDADATTASSAMVIVRISKPNNTDAEIMYDPAVDENGSSNSAAGSAVATVAALFVLAATALSARSA
ncbi:hypothetical protein FNF31_05903 [Cafeteria roenbergensis]|uniref:Auto-transporter adhesin head GIN domain-containing protein n=1 Tax=Cafeteria roenbergensis TaxID=33653 RepID=A0A5A8DJ75_CAFRO|nr:hypothetical protein FNF31_05903 [Cafeteria roenbergensis]KAA0163891.1 hypothetical protein FNF28_04085 [Cafeteria roenbergensis]